MHEEASIAAYVDRIIRAVPEANRPGGVIACAMGCPKANWIRTGDTVRCYCHSMGVISWPRMEVEECLDRERALLSER